MGKFEWGDNVKYKGKKYFVIGEKARVIKVRKIIVASNRVGHQILSIPNTKEVKKV